MGSIYCTLHTSKLYVMSCAVYIWRKQCKFGHFLQGSARSEFPAYIRDSIDGYLEESHKSTVLDVIGSFVNSKRYPPLQILHTIIQSLLVVSFRSQFSKENLPMIIFMEGSQLAGIAFLLLSS